MAFVSGALLLSASPSSETALTADVGRSSRGTKKRKHRYRHFDDPTDVLVIDVPPDSESLTDSGIHLLANYFHAAVQLELSALLSANVDLLECRRIVISPADQESFVVGATKELCEQAAMKALDQRRRTGGPEVHYSPSHEMAKALVRRTIALLVEDNRVEFDRLVAKASQ